MSANPSRPAMDRVERRGSWARAFDKVKAAMKRRDRASSTSRTRVLAPAADVAPTNLEASTRRQESEIEPHPVTVTNSAVVPTFTSASTNTTPASDIPGEAAAAVATPLTTTATTPIVPTPSPNGVLLAADTTSAVEADHTDGESDEPLLPMLSSRTGISEDRARDLFAKYGLPYSSARTQRPQQEPPNKIRRVEKPVRLRVHWTCHECSRQFGIEKTCAACGHRRCRECARHPPKRVREILETTRQAMEELQAAATEAEEAEATGSGLVLEETATTTDPDLQRYREEPAATLQVEEPSTEGPSHPKESTRTQATTASKSVSGSLKGSSLELDDSPEAEVDDEDDAPLPEIEFSTYTRPRAGMHAVLKPKAQIVRRICHKCDTQLLPPGRTECQNCGHARCDLCPRFPSKTRNRQTIASAGQEGEEEPLPMVRAVQRVYRKPRQRVRYTCEHCRTLFLETDRCTECGHERCHGCFREPPKRTSARHDPAVVQAVNDRLAAYGAGFGQHRSVAASAG